ncbi:MAG: hypothetical protein LUG86_01260 [Oscillospiraceae bacterium]|nr:hypothetical protein [Oscillospiraceae bacterium]
MKQKKIISLLVILVIAALMLPLSLFAVDTDSEEAEVIVAELETGTITLDDTSANNDELLEEYIEGLFGISDGTMLASTYGGEDALTGTRLGIYQTAREAISEIAAGNTTSTVFEMWVDWSFTGTEEEVNEEYAAIIQDVLSTIVRYLYTDNPSEMYWFDKTVGSSVAYTYHGVQYSDGTIVTTQIYVKYSLCVASGYQDSSAETPKYTVNASEITAAQTAVANAQAIAAKYKDYDDYERLAAFRDEICALVSYESGYETIDYGDVWQLVYVFDGDSTTNVVCEGYSKAFQYLCDLTATDNCECITVTGYMGTSSLGGHMWNVVYLDGVNYLVDITNSDTGMIGQNGGIFMACADDATKIIDGSETLTYTLNDTETTDNFYGYTFTFGSRTLTYVYNSSTTLEMYPYEEYLALGTKFYGRALTLDGEIGVTYYFTLAGVENPDDYYLTAAIGSGSTTKYELDDTVTISSTGITYCRYTVYVKPTDLTLTITATLTDGSSTVAVSNYSVSTYCTKAIENEDGSWSDATKALCEAVLNYGYYLDLWIDGTNTSNIDTILGLDSEWSDPVGTGNVDLSSYSVTSDGVEGKSLALDGEGIFIRIYGIDTSKTYTVSGKDVLTGTHVTYGDYIEFKVPAKEMDKIFTIYADGEKYTTYSIYSYINNTITNSTDENLVNLCEAIYYYCEAAKSYTEWV